MGRERRGRPSPHEARGTSSAGLTLATPTQPAPQLTYGAYLLSNLIQDVTIQTVFTNPVYYTWYTYMSWFVVWTCGSYFASFVLFMLVEAPCGNLQKLLMGGGKRAPTPRGSAKTVDSRPAGPEGVGLGTAATFNPTTLTARSRADSPAASPRAKRKSSWGAADAADAEAA